jgi:hypothetical protein
VAEGRTHGHVGPDFRELLYMVSLGDFPKKLSDLSICPEVERAGQAVAEIVATTCSTTVVSMLLIFGSKSNR